MTNSYNYVCFKLINFLICLELFVSMTDDKEECFDDCVWSMIHKLCHDHVPKHPVTIDASIDYDGTYLLGKLVSSAKFCYVGKNVNSEEALFNQSCTTNRTHVAESLLATEYSHNIQNKRTTNNSSLVMPGASVEYCYIFRHISSEFLVSGLTKESIQNKFACDFDDVCKGKEENTVIDNVELKGVMGKLHCCHQDNCNSIDKMPQTPVENQICYLGATNNSKGVIFESCGHPDSSCVTRTQFFKGGKIESYTCDNNRSCDKLNGAYNFCQNTTSGNITEQFCCCVMNKCNRPSDPSLFLKIKESQESSISPSTNTWKKILHPITNPVKTKDRSESLVRGLVASIVVVALLGIAVLLILAYRRRKRRDGGERRDPNVIMQYERLSCSDASLEGSVDV